MRLAILGGGQLAQMLAQAGARLGVRTRVLDPATDACAQSDAELVVGAYDDKGALDALVEGAQALTCEFESVPLETVARMEVRLPTRPGARSFGAARHRVHEKRALEAAGWRTARWAEVRSAADFDAALVAVGAPGVLKRCEGGYDGTGQAFVATEGDLASGFARLGNAPCVYEERIAFRRELSIVCCRGADGTFVSWPLVENVHDHGVLAASLAPAPGVDDALAQTARDLARRLCEDLGHVGVLTVEMFDAPDGLVANEIAPRVHNSGHWTIEGALPDQFEAHVRAVMGLPLEAPRTRGISVAVNLLGEVPEAPLPPGCERAAEHVYGKAPSKRPRRKVGHVTLVVETLDEALAARRALARWALGIDL